MPNKFQPSDGLLKPGGDMGFGLDFKKGSLKQHGSTKKESSLLPHSRRSSKEADKLKLKSGDRPQSGDLKQKAKLDSEGKIQHQESVRRKATENDELVKHMSNLPGYLQRADKVENFREKAFNVGVLDWSRLEKWKHKHIPVLASNFISFNSSESSSRTSTKPSTSIGSKEKLRDKKPIREYLPESTKLSFHGVKRFESSKSRTKITGDEKRMAPLAFESFGKTHSDISLGKERRNDHSKRTSQVSNLAPNSRLHGASSVPNENAKGRDGGAKQNMEGLQEYDHKKKERNHKSSFDMAHRLVKSKDNGASSSSKKMGSSSSTTRKKVDQLKESDFEVGGRQCDSKPSNIVLIYPQEVPQSSSSEDFWLNELRTSSDDNISASSDSSLSYVSLPEEVYDGRSELPFSSARHSSVGVSYSDTKKHRISTDLGTDCASVVSETQASIINKMSSLQSIGDCFEKDESESKLRDQCIFSNLKTLDQETAELTAQKEVNPSHNRRFSFSLSRIGRSFSFKEGPTIPQYCSTYISTKSGPVTPQSSVRWDNLSSEKAKIHNRNRSSPLRRLLDPLLKHKASDKHHYSAESSQTPDGSVSSSFRSISVNGSLFAEKSKGTLVQGLLQLTLKNGVPLFKFVINNERKFFAATRNSLASLEKGESAYCYTFYLVNEIKKKSGGWIGHGGKEKSCGYAYNVVAQMKFSSSEVIEPINQNFDGKRIVKEYVLSGVEIGQADQGPPKFIKSAELAAVIFETSGEKGIEELHGDDTNLPKKGCSKCFSDERCFCSSGDIDTSGCTKVILPGGMHGSPIKGEPTPLIYRWKTGGSCDCGGWDIGCKLLVLSNQTPNLNIPKCYKHDHDRFQLFIQEGAEQGTPYFTLLPLKDGFYSIEFNSTITHLQAFFISITVLSSTKLPGSLEMAGMHEEILKEHSSKNTGKLQGKAPLKYAPIPPLSPVGRV